MWLMYVLNQLHVGALQCVHVQYQVHAYTYLAFTVVGVHKYAYSNVSYFCFFA